MKSWILAVLLIGPVQKSYTLGLPNDDIDMPSYTLNVRDNDSIDVPTHLFPSLYREPSVNVFDSTRWYNNTSLLFDWSPQLVVNSRTSRERLNGFAFGWLKEFTPAHAFRLRASFDRHRKYVGVDLGYLLNLTNYYWGYDRNRRNTWSLVTGIDAGKQNKENTYMGGYVGLHYDHALTPYSSLFLEPRWGIYGQYYAPALMGSESDDPVISAISAQVGYRFRLSEHTTRMPELRSIGEQYDHNWFIEMGGTMHEEHSFIHVTHEREGEFTDIYGNVMQGGIETVTRDTLMFGSGISLGLGYKGNSYSAALARVDLSKVNSNLHLTTAIDYLFSFTNAYLGENEHRHTDLDFLIGPVMMIDHLDKDKSQLSVGIEWGARMARHFSPSWEVYVEPRWNYVKCYSDGADGLRYLNFQPSFGFAYTYQHRGYLQSTHQQPMQGWYVQNLFGMELATFDSDGGSHQLGMMDFNIGRDLTALWGGRLGFFTGSMKNGEKDPVSDSYTDLAYPMFYSYYGVRAEAVMHFLRMWKQQLEKSRWNWSFSGGMEFGQISNLHRNQLGFTVGSQLQYRMTSQTWLTLGGRYRAVAHGEAIKPLEGMIGVQYDFTQPRKYDFDPIPYHFYVQGGGTFCNAFFNMDEVGYNVSVGADFNRVNGVRINMLSTKDHRTLLGVDYVNNFTAALLGENPSRRADMSVMVGVEADKERLSDGKEGLGLGMGLEVDYHLNRHFSLFVTPRLNYMPWDSQCQPMTNERWSMYTLFGIRFDLRKKSDN